MNDETCSDRRQPLEWPRRAGFLAGVAGVALLAAACGGSPSSATGGSAYQQALPFAQCMRSHGIGNFPDPDTSGNFDTSSIPASPQYDAAQRTCVRLHPYNMVLAPQQQAHLMSEALKFARCMRAHGVPNFPDPTQNNTGISFGGQTTAGSPPGQGGSSPGAGPGRNASSQPSTVGSSESPQYQAAAQACRSYAGKGKS
jgi:hypothetical protein